MAKTLNQTVPYEYEFELAYKSTKKSKNNQKVWLCTGTVRNEGAMPTKMIQAAARVWRLDVPRTISQNGETLWLSLKDPLIVRYRAVDENYNFISETIELKH